MTTYSFDKISGGTYTGSGAAPSSGNSGTINTGGTNRQILIACLTARAINGGNSGDFHAVSSITASGLTFTRVLHSTFHYTDSVNGGSFPDGWLSLDVFVAPAAAQQTALSWSATMAAANDTFVNDGWCCVFDIAGAGGLDTHASNLVTSSNLTNVASAVVSGSLTTDSNNPLVIELMFGHSAGPSTVALPSGFASTFSGAGGDGHFLNPTNAGATKADCFLAFQEFASAQVSASYSSATSVIDWATALIAFKELNPPTIPSRSFAAVQT